MISNGKTYGWSVLVALALVACGGAGAGSVEYSVSAQRNYEKGLDSLKGEDWVAASKYFAFIKSRFPYSKFATLAELRMADAEFGADQYPEAIDAYRVFIRLHPTHEMVVNGYASFRIGEAYYKQLSGESWILPPAAEGDQSSNEDAAAELVSYVEKYPQSPYRQKAQEILKKVSKKLADHEWYVAQYYWKRDKPMGTVLRLRKLLDRYRGVGYDEEALWLLGRAYQSVSMTERARATWQELLQKHPQHLRAAAARDAMAALPKGAAPAAPAGPTGLDKPASPAPTPTP
ncbi:MAG: outer membrane protein assembly factor BamD [Myxococcales bacterium]|nr:outer membrane protein assembly factor BamD [Myxococcales bacterium]